MRNKQRRPSLRFPRSRYASADGFDREPRPPIHPRTRNRGWNKRKVGTVHKGALQRDAYNRQVTAFEAAPLTKPPALRGGLTRTRWQGIGVFIRVYRPPLFFNRVGKRRTSADSITC